ncbi:MAG: inositol monophosphatase family protein [Casimicrobiaceae bacterium]|nr:inositol monophosphatase family protein [Casimicrobiaceae bacterium]MCX8099218.1 inositol monophosphatase family protein [Casimicrobiaceae bacterium]MDW8311408.1 inositol monophosphatase family protein [Burkholderiales bacterium]
MLPRAEYRAFAEHLADLARPIAKRYFRSALTVIDKPDATPVTLADQEIEAAVRSAIEARYPEHGVIGEEHGSIRAEAETVWVIDPIDGTKAFTCGKPQFGTLIALWHRGEPLLGLIDQPITGERWIGVRGQGAWFNGAPMRVRPRAECLAEAIVLMSAPDLYDDGHETTLARIRGAVKGIYYGGDCYNYAMVAAGHADLVIERGLKVVDYAALVNPIEEAGGVVCDWAGQAFRLTSDGTIVAAASRALAEEALALLAEARGA